MNGNRLTRPTDHRMIAGVCAGLADYLDIDAAIVRIAFVVAFFVGFSASFWIYILLWVVMPERSRV